MLFSFKPMKITVFLSLVLSSASLQFSMPVQAASLDCAEYHSKILGRNVRYCMDRSRPELAPEPGEAVTYFMHGTNGGAQSWVKNNYQNSLHEVRESNLLTPMTFVSFDTSAYSFFTDHPVKPGSPDTSEAYETWFIQEFIPYIESTLGVCGKRECRGIMGESMGGLGALKTALKHPDMFSTVAVNSPASSPFLTREPFMKWIEFFGGKRIGPLKGLLVTSIFFHVFPDEKTFDENNPTYLVGRFPDTASLPNIYFDMGGKDNYGFYVGYGLFKAALDLRQFPYTTFFEANGHHDMWERHAKDAILFMENHVIPPKSSVQF
jgi:S-formylglutathione hydrolase FrmB